MNQEPARVVEQYSLDVGASKAERAIGEAAHVEVVAEAVLDPR